MPYCASNISYVFPDLVLGSKYLCICLLFVCVFLWYHLSLWERKGQAVRYLEHSPALADQFHLD